MNRLIPTALLLGLLASCAQNSGTSPDVNEVGLPPLATGVTVSFPAAPDRAHLALVSAKTGNIVYDLPIAKGATSQDVSPTKWQTGSNAAQARPIAELLPSASNVSVQPEAAEVALFSWVMWIDNDSNGKFENENDTVLPLMTHDRVTYASDAVNVSFRTDDPKMMQTWQLWKGWSRAEHYVYLPTDDAYHQRFFRSSPLNHYVLHEPTPETSQ